jgi:2-hydroxycyclohexanecarboxyl-CoA dehydrogenase
MGIEARAAVVTGAGRGIGRHLALDLGAQGAAVVVADIDGDAARETADLVSKAGGEALAIEVDVSDAAAVHDLAGICARDLDRPVQILINNAGISQRFDSLLTAEPSYIERVLGVNLLGQVHCAQTFVPGMMAAGWGRVINLSSIAAFSRATGVYGMSKLAVIGFTQNLAREVGARGVTVNAIAPGFIRSAWQEEAGAMPVIEKIVSDAPVPRVGEAADLVGMMRLLCGEASGYITGQVMFIDGGQQAHL